MSKYAVSANGVVFGVFDADDEQGARDACAQDAGYKSEADMVENLERPSELIAAPINPAYERNASDFRLWGEYVDPNAEMSEDEFDALSMDDKIKLQVEAFGATGA